MSQSLSFSKAKDRESQQKIEWIGSDTYPRGYPSKRSGYKYIPLTADRELVSGINRICNEILRVNALLDMNLFAKEKNNDSLLKFFTNKIYMIFQKYTYKNEKAFKEQIDFLVKKIQVIKQKDIINDNIVLSKIFADIFLEFLNEVKRKVNGLKEISQFSFHPNDFKVAKVNFQKFDVQCRAFTQYHMHIDRMFGTCFSQRVKEENTTENMLEQEMKEWGCSWVKRSKPGDIIVYLRSNQTNAFAMHMGIYLSDKCVISKWGFSPIYEHDFSTIRLDYGDHIRFYRKKYKFMIVNDFIVSEIPLVLTVSGIFTYCVNLFERLWNIHEANMLPFSLLGRYCMLPLKAKFLDHATKYKEELVKIVTQTAIVYDTDIKRRDEIIEGFKAIALRVSEECTLNFGFLYLDPSKQKI